MDSTQRVSHGCACCGEPVDEHPRACTDAAGRELAFCSEDCEIFMMGVPA